MKRRTDKRTPSIFRLKEGMDLCLEMYFPAVCSVLNNNFCLNIF